jgi:hypothetical protein
MALSSQKYVPGCTLYIPYPVFFPSRFPDLDPRSRVQKILNPDLNPDPRNRNKARTGSVINIFRIRILWSAYSDQTSCLFVSVSDPVTE